MPPWPKPSLSILLYFQEMSRPQLTPGWPRQR